MLFCTNFRLRELVFIWYFLHTFIFVHTLQYFVLAFLAANFLAHLEKQAHIISSSLSIFFKSPTISRPQQQTKVSIYAKKVSIFESSSRYQATFRLVYIVIYSTSSHWLPIIRRSKKKFMYSIQILQYFCDIVQCFNRQLINTLN